MIGGTSDEIMNLYKLIFEIYKCVDLALLFTYKRGKDKKMDKREIDIMTSAAFLLRTLLGAKLLVNRAPNQFKRDLIESTFGKKIDDIQTRELADEFLLEEREAQRILEDLREKRSSIPPEV